MVRIPSVLHLDICEKNLELISSRNHICVARSKDYQRALGKALLVGMAGRPQWPFLVPCVPFYSLSLLLLFRTLLLMNLETIPKGNRQNKSYFEGTHKHLDIKLYPYAFFYS